MIRINLVPQQRNRRQQAVQNELQIFAAGVVVLVVLMAVAYLFTQSRVSSLREENQRLQADIAQKQDLVKEMEVTQKAQEDLRERLRVIKQLKLSKSGPVRMLAELSDAAPDKLQLTSLEEADGEVQLSGVAASNEVISQFLSNLERSPYFDDVFLNAIDQTELSGRKLKSFSISARLVIVRQEPPADPEKKTP